MTSNHEPSASSTRCTITGISNGARCSLVAVAEQFSSAVVIYPHGIDRDAVRISRADQQVLGAWLLDRTRTSRGRGRGCEGELALG